VKEIESERERERVCVLLVAVHVGKSRGKRVERLVQMGPFSLSLFLALSLSFSLSHIGSHSYLMNTVEARLRDAAVVKRRKITSKISSNNVVKNVTTS